LNPAALKTAGDAIDQRINVIACPKKWKEADVWESAMHGGKHLWARACTGEWLQKKSRIHGGGWMIMMTQTLSGE